MFLTVLAMLTLATGATVEVSVESAAICNRLQDEVRAGTLVEVEDYAGVKFRVVDVQCRTVESKETLI